MDPLKDTINDGELSAEKLLDHGAGVVGRQLANLLPALEGYELVIRISLERKP